MIKLSSREKEMIEALNTGPKDTAAMIRLIGHRFAVYKHRINKKFGYDLIQGREIPNCQPRDFLYFATSRVDLKV